jgi:hypothetical protein
VWIVDVQDKVVEAFAKPSRGMYRQQRVPKRGGTLAPLAFPKHAIMWDTLFG